MHSGFLDQVAEAAVTGWATQLIVNEQRPPIASRKMEKSHRMPHLFTPCKANPSISQMTSSASIHSTLSRVLAAVAAFSCLFGIHL